MTNWEDDESNLNFLSYMYLKQLYGDFVYISKGDETIYFDANNSFKKMHIWKKIMHLI